MSRRTVALVLTLIAVLLPLASLQAGEPAAAELRAEVPALDALHAVVVPIWHEAWPAKDIPALKAALPELQARAAEVEKAALPGILRDRRQAWDTALEALRSAVSGYAAAAAGEDAQALLDAAEAVHAAFEGLVRAVRPPMPALEAFHTALYPLVHYTQPEGKLGAAHAAIEELARRCEPLATAPLPRRAAAREAQVREAIAALCAASETLRGAAASGDGSGLAPALEEVHARYQAVVALLE